MLKQLPCAPAPPRSCGGRAYRYGRGVERRGVSALLWQGCVGEVREQVWPVLLRLVSISATAEQQAAVRADLARRYSELLQRCQVRAPLTLRAAHLSGCIFPTWRWALLPLPLGGLSLVRMLVCPIDIAPFSHY